MYKRPIPRRSGSYELAAPKVFDETSRIGEILINMKNTNVTRPRPSSWRPCWDYEFVARRLPDNERDAYINRCEEWLTSHKPSVGVEKHVPTINTEPIIELMAIYGIHRPPMNKCEMAWRAAGYSESKISKGLAYMRMLDETVEERQTTLDSIFSKWNTTAKTVTKPKKVIKAVKKRL
jgi:hypothetical protein